MNWFFVATYERHEPPLDKCRKLAASLAGRGFSLLDIRTAGLRS